MGPSEKMKLLNGKNLSVEERILETAFILYQTIYKSQSGSLQGKFSRHYNTVVEHNVYMQLR